MAIISSLTQSARRWRPGTKLAKISATAPVGTRFRFTLDQAARVTMVFKRRVGGRRVGGRCVKQTAANRTSPQCRRWVRKGALRFDGRAGLNRVRFQGRLTATKRLRPGRYRVVVGATTSAGRSTPQALTFRIVRR